MYQEDESSDTVDVELTDPDDAFLLSFVGCDVDVTTADETKSLPKQCKSRARDRKQILTRSEQKTDNNFDDDEDDDVTATALESSAREVLDRFGRGCECRGSCFKGLNAENVYRHRLNIAELTKEEHHMYLMGVSMASLANPKETSRHKERVRQRASYVYHGQRVCLDAFLYLENVTHYQLKRVRSHVMANGVVPRVHGNVRKKPHNTFSLDMYKTAENFLKTTLTQYTSDAAKHCFIVNESRTSIYEKFKQNIPVGGKIMGYSTFRHFLKKQFPQVRFSSRPSDATVNRLAQTKDGAQRKQASRTFSKSQKAIEPCSTKMEKIVNEPSAAINGEEECHHWTVDTEIDEEQEVMEEVVFDGQDVQVDKLIKLDIE